MSFQFDNYKLNIVLHKFQNNTLCIECVLDDGEPYSRLSTNLDHREQSENKTFIKENDEMYSKLVNAMIKAGYIQPLGVRSTSGYNTYQLYQVLPKCFEDALQY